MDLYDKVREHLIEQGHDFECVSIPQLVMMYDTVNAMKKVSGVDELRAMVERLTKILLNGADKEARTVAAVEAAELLQRLK